MLTVPSRGGNSVTPAAWAPVHESAAILFVRTRWVSGSVHDSENFRLCDCSYACRICVTTWCQSPSSTSRLCLNNSAQEEQTVLRPATAEPEIISYIYLNISQKHQLNSYEVMFYVTCILYIFSDGWYCTEYRINLKNCVMMISHQSISLRYVIKSF